MRLTRRKDGAEKGEKDIGGTKFIAAHSVDLPWQPCFRRRRRLLLGPTWAVEDEGGKIQGRKGEKRRKKETRCTMSAHEDPRSTALPPSAWWSDVQRRG